MEPKIIIYLNHQKNTDRVVCVLYFKIDKAINNRICQNNWIVWNTQIKQFTVQSTPQTVGLLIDVFEDIAEINTHYYHAILMDKTNKITIGDATYYNGILESRPKIGSVMFIPYKDVNNRFLIIKYKYKKEVNQLLVNCKQAKWNASLNEFTLDTKIINIIDFIKYASPKLKIQLYNKLEISNLRCIQE